MYIDPQWLRYMAKYREIVRERYKFRLERNRVPEELYNELLSDRNKALDYITRLCNDVENLIIENSNLRNKVKMMEENLYE